MNNTQYVHEAHGPGSISIIRGDKEVEVTLRPKLETFQTTPPKYTHGPLCHFITVISFRKGPHKFCCLPELPYPNANTHGGGGGGGDPY